MDRRTFLTNAAMREHADTNAERRAAALRIARETRIAVGKVYAIALDVEMRRVAILALNTFGSADHPAPSIDTLPHFALAYVIDVLDTARTTEAVPVADRMACDRARTRLLNAAAMIDAEEV